MNRPHKEILIVEDDDLFAQSLVATVELADYSTQLCKDLSSAKLAVLERSISLILLDVGLPDGDGIQFCSELRTAGHRQPILLLTAEVDEGTAVRGLDAGANDFLRKPFGNRELVARIGAALRTMSPTQQKIRYRELQLDIEGRSAFFRSEKLQLNRRQFDILHYFVLYADMIVTREKLLAFLGNEQDVFCRSIDTHVSSIRKVLRQVGANELRISMIYGMGYRFEEST